MHFVHLFLSLFAFESKVPFVAILAILFLSEIRVHPFSNFGEQSCWENELVPYAEEIGVADKGRMSRNRWLSFEVLGSFESAGAENHPFSLKLVLILQPFFCV